MALVEVTPPAGIVKNGTDYANKNRFVDGDLVRFENGYLKPLGGWTKFRNNPLGTFFSTTLTTTNGSNTITATTSVAHGFSVGTTFIIEDYASTGGIPNTELNNQTFAVASVPSTTTFTFTTSTSASSSATSSAFRIIIYSTPIGMYSYNANNGEKVLAVGTRAGVNVFYENTWYDITPVGFIADDVITSVGYGAYPVSYTHLRAHET